MLQYSLHDIERNLDGLFVERGRSYASRGCVLDLHVTDDGRRCTALVRGSDFVPYRVSIDLEPVRGAVKIRGSCTCPVGDNCKHVAAALLSNLQRPHGALVRHAAHADEPAPPEAPHAGKPGDRAQPQPIPVALREWLDRAQPAPRHERPAPPQTPQLLYLLRIDGAPGAPRTLLQTVTARRLKSGRFGKTAAWSNARTAVHAPPRFVTVADAHLLRRMLLDLSTEMGDTFVLGGDDAAGILDEALATGRCYWLAAEGPPLSRGPARSGRLRWQLDAIGVQAPVIETDPPLAACLPVAPPWYVDPAAGQCGPIELGVPAHTGQLIATLPPVPPAHVKRVRASLAALDGATKLPLPATLATEQRNARQITPCLRFSSFRIYVPRGFRLNALGEILDVVRLTFDYEGVPVLRDAPNVLTTFRDGRLLRMPRMPAVERAAHARLEQLGFVPARQAVYVVPSENRHDYVLTSVRDWLRFIGEDLPVLQREGWQVEFDDEFRFRLANVSAWSARVEPAGADWFDLRLQADIDGRSTDLMPILVAAMRQEPALLAQLRDPQVPDSHPLLLTLDDGRLLPAEAGRLRAVLTVLHELLDAPPAEAMRLSRLDAARLAHLEHDAGVRWDGEAALRSLAQQLAGFERIRPVDPPHDFAAALRPYQRDGLAWLQFLRESGLNGILADDMGLGKTIQALAHILIEKQAGRLDRPALVISPTSVLPNWRAEIERFAPGLRVHVSHGMGRQAGFGRLGDADVVLTTYPLLSRDKAVLHRQPFHLVILDEAQVIKNAQTQAARIVGTLQARHRLCMTGTPLENHLGELWSLFDFLMPGFLGDARGFRQRYRTPIEKHADPARRDSLVRRIRPFILRRTKEQVATELPPKSEIVRSVEFDERQRDLYETVRLSMHERVRAEIAARGLNQSQIVVLDALLKLRQICCDPRLLQLEVAHKVNESAKLDLLMDMLYELLEEGRKVLLFSQFTTMLALIEAQLQERGIRYVKLTGETRNRAQPVKAFQGGQADLFLISLKAGGTGLNLTAADTVIHYDPWWNPAVENQATDRAHRIGQDKPVFVYKLIVAGSVEEKIQSLQQRKARLAASVLDDVPRNAGTLSAEDIEALFAPIDG